MAEWDWNSSDIGDMTPESFGDDYYYTGGKFTDWSGDSAGRFDEKPSYWDKTFKHITQKNQHQPYR